MTEKTKPHLRGNDQSNERAPYKEQSLRYIFESILVGILWAVFAHISNSPLVSVLLLLLILPLMTRRLFWRVDNVIEIRYEQMVRDDD